MHDEAFFGAQIKRRRRQFDLMQAALARQVGCAPITIKKIEAGALRPSRQIAELLAHHLEVPPAERAAFVRLARTPSLAPPLSPTANPYKGLRAFDEADAADFFGRTALVERLGWRAWLSRTPLRAFWPWSAPRAAASRALCAPASCPPCELARSARLSRSPPACRAPGRWPLSPPPSMRCTRCPTRSRCCSRGLRAPCARRAA